MKYTCSNRRHGLVWSLTPLTMGLLVTAGLLFAFSFVFYFLSFISL